jgi:hypothetical protein
MTEVPPGKILVPTASGWSFNPVTRFIDEKNRLEALGIGIMVDGEK